VAGFDGGRINSDAGVLLPGAADRVVGLTWRLAATPDHPRPRRPDDPLHGHQEGRFFHGYYDCHRYLPLYTFCGRHLLAAKLRPSNIDASAGAIDEVARIVAQVRARWPRTRILLRADICGLRCHVARHSGKCSSTIAISSRPAWRSSSAGSWSSAGQSRVALLESGRCQQRGRRCARCARL
jgi:hypothetical protein